MEGRPAGGQSSRRRFPREQHLRRKRRELAEQKFVCFVYDAMQESHPGRASKTANPYLGSK
jgi:hypothetical protein